VATISEEQLSRWTKKAFVNEDEKAENTESMIREAIRSDPFLASLSTEVYAKGSYKNSTNVRRDSDVDVAVEYRGMITPRYGAKTSREEVRRVRGTRSYSGPFRDAAGDSDIMAFKDAVGAALVKAFGPDAVARHDKVFTVRASSLSLAADVVPANTYRKYITPNRYHEGIRLISDRAPEARLVNYPHRHYANGVTKNEETSLRFKRVVRILKNLENKMVEDGACPEVASYLIECLIYNAPTEAFGPDTWGARTRKVLVHAWEDTGEAESESRWYEVDGWKYLFGSHQRWTREEAREFIHCAWQYVKDS
jgi:hypothetical protein